MTRPSKPAPFDLDKLAPEAKAFMESEFRKAIEEHVPHNRALGLEYVGIDRGRLLVRLPYREELVGNPATGVLHGGAITALMDTTCGLAVLIRLFQPIPVATLDLRIDYLKPAKPGENIIARADCFKLTERVAFARCEAFLEGREDDLVAVANGTFMIFRGKTFVRPESAA